MGPSVKFVSAIKDAIFNKKNGGKFFLLKKCQTGGGGGGGGGGLGKDNSFFRGFFFATFPKQGHLSLLDFLFLVQLYLNQGVLCRNIGQEQLRVKQSFSARKTTKNSLFRFNSNGLLK